MHPNEQMLRELDDAFNRGDMETVFSYFTDDVVVHSGGRSSLAGDYQGKEAFKELFGRFYQSLGDNPQFGTHAVLANDEHGVFLQESTGTKGEQTVTIRSFGVVHFRDGKVSEFWTVDEDPYTADPFYDS